MAEIAFDTMPYARDIFRELDSAESEPIAVLIRGRSGTGKSALLGAVRARLRSRDVPLWDKIVAQPVVVGANAVRPVDFAPNAALIIDNAHTLSESDLESLCADIESGHRTVIVATQPRPHDDRLRALADTVARRGRVVDLRPLGVSDITPFARELGMAVPRSVAHHIHQQTGGIRGGVVAALTAACSTRFDAGVRAVDDAVSHWARTQLDNLDPDLLETLAVATTGTGLDSSELTEVLGLNAETARRLIDRARASALVTDADLLLAPAVPALRTVLGDRRYLAVQRRLLTARLDAGLLRDQTALAFAESGVRDDRLAEFLCAAAEHAGGEAVRYYAAAAAAGIEPDRIALRWAEAAARVGDGDTAMRLAEPVLARPGASAAELADAVRICAGVLTRRGLVERAAQLYTWLGAHRVQADWAVATTVHYLAGDITAAADLSDAAAQWPPTEADAQARLVANALAHTLTRAGADPAAAVSALVQAAHLDASTDRFLPCTAVSIATLLCLSTGQPRRGGEALLRAADSGRPGQQSRVLAAWVAMLGGDEQRAAATVSTFDWKALDPRDRLLAHGVAVGLARRGGDTGALARAWQAAYPLFDDVDADLLTLLPIGELWLAAVRMKEERRIAPLVEASAALLRGLGQPPTWANAFHWYGVQAAIAHESPDELLPHARLLKAAAESGDRHAAVLADAGRTWVFVLRGEVSAQHVASAVTGLRGIGLTWDAARLASEAALATDDSAAATALLKLARAVRTDARPSEQQAPQPGPAAGAGGHDTAAPEPVADGAAMLSEREREVAELVLLGLTYREIGARLYISAKTVEHHVARIRRRIGAGSRSELLSMLRAMGHGSLLV